MAKTDEGNDGPAALPSRTHLVRFEIKGLLGGGDISLDFPNPLIAQSGPALMILSGRNGVGKTTILRMIGGMLELNFDQFRRVPFTTAELVISTGQTLRVERTIDKRMPLKIEFGDLVASLGSDREKGEYTAEEADAVNRFRRQSLPILSGIKYEMVELDRLVEPQKSKIYVDPYGRQLEAGRSSKEGLAEQVRDFLRDAQINQDRFFQRQGVGFLPRLLDRLESSVAPSRGELLERIDAIKRKMHHSSDMGLYTNADQLDALESLLQNGLYDREQQRLLMETYVEAQEDEQKRRDLLVDRITQFERTMNEFFSGKQVNVNPRFGLRIMAGKTRLDEHQLSSGERHFLTMMVVALLCQRTGTIIAIDEPELSLHISWQRKLVRALAKCAAGASPLFIFATHSLAISAEHADRVHRLSAID